MRFITWNWLKIFLVLLAIVSSACAHDHPLPSRSPGPDTYILGPDELTSQMLLDGEYCVKYDSDTLEPEFTNCGPGWSQLTTLADESGLRELDRDERLKALAHTQFSFELDATGIHGAGTGSASAKIGVELLTTRDFGLVDDTADLSEGVLDTLSDICMDDDIDGFVERVWYGCSYRAYDSEGKVESPVFTTSLMLEHGETIGEGTWRLTGYPDEQLGYCETNALVKVKIVDKQSACKRFVRVRRLLKLREEAAERESELKQCIVDKEVLEERVDVLEKDLAVLSTKHSSLEEALNETDKQLDERIEVNRKLQKEKEHWKTEASKLEGKFEQAEKQRNEAKEKREKLEIEKDSLISELARTKGDKEHLVKKLAAVNEKIKTREDEVKDLENKVVLAKKGKDEALKKAEELEIELEVRKELVAEVDSTVDQLQSKLASQKAKLADLEEREASAPGDADRADVRDKLARLREQTSETEASIERLRKKIAQLEQDDIES